MAKAVLPIQLGFDYQSMLFWSKACDLFLPYTKTGQVEYEIDDAKSFDDVVVKYSGPILDRGGEFKTRDYFQAKFHSHDTAPILYSSLTDPSFIGATTTSFLQKLLAAYRTAVASGERYGYHLFSPSVVHPDDILGPIWSKYDGRLNIDRLFEGKTAKSAMWTLRDEWIRHLAIEERELRSVISTMCLVQGPDIVRFRENLNTKLHLAGLRPIENGTLSNSYDDLVRKLHAAGVSMSFTRNDIEKITKAEGLWVGEPRGYPREKTIGIRSFLRFAEEMPNLTYDMVCLTPYFEGRHLKPDASWNADVLQHVSAFMRKYEALDETLYLLLETHISIAFAAGMSVDPKSPAVFIPVQKSEFRKPEIWSVSGDRTSGENWSVEELMAEGTSDDLVVAFDVTHSIGVDVKDFVERSMNPAHTVTFAVLPRSGNNSIRDGNHAFTLAQEAAEIIVKKIKSERIKSLHIFAAAPTAFMFYLGRLLRLPRSCEITVYEYDFDSKELGAYKKAITFNEISVGE